MTSKLSRLAGIIASLHEGASTTNGVGGESRVDDDINNNGGGDAQKYVTNGVANDTKTAPIATKIEPDLTLNEDHHPPTLQAQFAQTQLRHAHRTPTSTTSSSTDAQMTAMTLCSVCGAAVGNRAHLTVHMRRHAGYKPFSCSRCAYSAFDDDDVKAHIAKSHTAGECATVRFIAVPRLESDIELMIDNSKRVALDGSVIPQTASIAQTKSETTPPSTHKRQLPSSTTTNASVPPHKLARGGIFPTMFGNGTTAAVDANPLNAAALQMQFIQQMMSMNQSARQAPAPTSSTEQLASLMAMGMNTPAEFGSGDTFECSLCNTQVNGATRSIISHICSHLTLGTLTCPLCSSNAHNVHASWTALVAHITRSHSGEHAARTRDATQTARVAVTRALVHISESCFARQPPSIMCQVCQRGVTLHWSQLRRHIAEHARNTPFKCRKCTHSFVDVGDVRMHMRQQHASDSASSLTFVYAPHFAADDAFAINMQRAFPAISPEAMEVAIQAAGKSTPHAITQNQQQSNDVQKMMLGMLQAQQQQQQQQSNYGVQLMQQIQEQQQQARAITQQEEATRANLMCQMCNASISRTMSSVIAHAKVHLGYKPYHCAHCSFRHFAMGKIKKHHAKVHSKLPVKVSVHHVADLGTLVKDMKKKCFGAFASSTAWDQLDGGQTDLDAQLEDAPLPHEVVDTAVSSVTAVEQTKCNMCDALVAVGQVAQEQHAGVHLDYAPYSCNICSQFTAIARDEVVAHIMTSHAGEKNRVVYRPVPSLVVEAQTLARTRCFPPPVAAAVDTVECRMCAADGKTDVVIVALEQSMDGHIQVAHIGEEKHYHCPVCTYQTTNVVRAKQHVHSAHPHSQETRIYCCPSDGLVGLQALRRRAFGADVWAARAAETVSGLLLTNRDGSDQYNTVALMETAQRVTCQVCNALVSNGALAMTTHARTHLTDYRPYKCSHCHFTAVTELDVKEHIINNHKNSALVSEFSGEHKQLISMQTNCFPQSIIGGEMIGACTPTYKNTPPTSARGTPNFWRASNDASTPGGNTMLKKLTCMICKSTIADNPKSIGIHVKNHLEYKPYRCPYCKYSSCEQSKARRHVEHVHNVSGDLVISETQPDIKEKIIAMRVACFPTLNGTRSHLDSINDGSVDGRSQMNTPNNLLKAMPNGSGSATPVKALFAQASQSTCQLCKESVVDEAIGAHVDRHVEQTKCQEYTCGHCATIVYSEEAVVEHITAEHDGKAFEFTAPTISYDAVRQVTMSKCFPPTATYVDEMEDEDEEDDMEIAIEDESSSAALEEYLAAAAATVTQSGVPTKSLSKSQQAAAQQAQSSDGRLTCTLCDSPVSVNPNSLDVHSKTHLNFKQHQCAYCPYRSCMSAKVKRHLDNVHKLMESKQTSLSQLPLNVRGVVNEMRNVCFPQLECLPTIPRTQLDAAVARLRDKLVVELHAAADDVTLDAEQRLGCLSAAQTVLVPDVASVNGGVPSPDMDTSSSDDITPVRTSTPLPPTLTSMPSLADQMAHMHSTMLARFEAATMAAAAAANATSSRYVVDDEAGEDDCTTSSSSALNASMATGGQTPTVGKQTCAQCQAIVVDTSLALLTHMRTHLDYKPYVCQMCDYRADALSKVKRHSRQMHKMTDETHIVYQPLEDIRHKCLEMQRKCFPHGTTEINFDAILNADSYASASASNQPSINTTICQLCSTSVTNSLNAKRDHVTKAHCQAWYCSDCGYEHASEEAIKQHALDEHQSITSMPIRLELDANVTSSSATSASAVDDQQVTSMLTACFANNAPNTADTGMSTPTKTTALRDELDDYDEGDDDDSAELVIAPMSMNMGVNIGKTSGCKIVPPSGKIRSDGKPVEGPRYICAVCGTAVSMYASSLYVHVKNHINYKPYACSQCDYRTPVKSKARRHVLNAHRNDGRNAEVVYEPLAGIEQEIKEMKETCFPDVTPFSSNTSTANMTSEKVHCHICQEDVADTQLARQMHAKNHLGEKPYHCPFCAYTAGLKADTRRHVSREHPDETVRVVYRADEVSDGADVTHMLAQCFRNSTPSVPSMMNMMPSASLMLADDDHSLPTMTPMGR